MSYKYISKVFSYASIGIILAGTPAFAAGTEAGTEIVNEFTLNYKSSGIDRPQVDNLADPTRFIVDHRVDFTTADNSSNTGAVPDQTDYVLEFTMTNLGNKDINYNFFTSPFIGDFALSTAPTIEEYWIDTNGNGTQDGSEPTVDYATSPEPIIPQDTTVYVTVGVNIPAGAQDGETAQILFGASATDGSGTTLLADATNTLLGEEILLDDGAGVIDSVVDGIHTVTTTITIVTAVLTGSKTVAMLPPEACDIATQTSNPTAYNTPTPDTAGNFAVPGSCALYTISVSNTGSDEATDISMADILPDNVILHRIEADGFDGGSFPASLSADISAGITAGNGGLVCDGTASTCDATFSGANLDSGDDATITYRVIVES